MIAQGAFQELLLAGTDARGKIFRDIFGTQLYADFQRRAADDANRLERECAQMDADLLRTMQSVLDALKALGIDAKDMQTDNYTVSPVYDYQNTKLDSQQILIGYAVTNNVTVTVRQLDQLPALLDAAVAAGANQTYGINFQSSKSDEAYDQALAAAAKDAVRKAGLLATALGRTPGDLISVQEANDAYPAYASSKSAVYDSAATPIETGTLSVAANVRVQMALQ